MTLLQHPAIIQLLTAFSPVQRTARTLKDIGYGIGKYTPYLRAASDVLNSLPIDQDAALNTQPPLFILGGELALTENCGHKLQHGVRKCQYKVHTEVVYFPEPGLDLKFVFNNLPELGISFENGTAASYVGQPAAARLQLAPEKWPMVASFLISTVSQDESLSFDAISQFMLNHYPGLPRDMVRDFVRTGLYTSPVELCDFLVDNAEINPVYTGALVMPADL